MKALVEILKQIAEKYPLEKKYPGKIPPDLPIDIPPSASTNYEIDVYLKENLYSRIMTNGKKSEQSLEDYYWIIQKWGGIGIFKQTEARDQRIKKFINELDEGELTSKSFKTISSLSKVASFIKPDEYVIYDSRAIFSLNWLLFGYTNEKILFKQPSGQNQTLKKYDMPTIFHLSKRGIEYRCDESSYHAYCSLINHLAPLVFGLGSRPYKLEMLLYTIAAEKDKDSWIVEDIKKRVSIEIAPPV